jgi:hypothetical protein
MDNQKRYEPFAQYAQKEGRPLEDGLLFVHIEQTLCILSKHSVHFVLY